MPMHAPPLRLAHCLLLPAGCKAILWDMDGVLIDSLGLDIRICNQLVAERFGEEIQIPEEFIRSIFALHPPAFWQRIFRHLDEQFQVTCDAADQERILATYEEQRVGTAFEVLPGIAAILAEARAAGLALAVVSNNLTRDVHTILQRSGLHAAFDLIVGNDIEGFRKKPAPDCYLHAARQLGVAPEACVVVEDSLLGLEAGFRAGCHAIAVATGGTDAEILSESGMASQVYTAFTPQRVEFLPGALRDKRIVTPNDFVSHMVEHIAWRLGMGIHLDWNNDQWPELGRMLGEALGAMPRHQERAAALGMIDDGSAEILLDFSSPYPGAELIHGRNLDMEWFLGLRCEQAASGRPLWDLLTGIAQGMKAAIRVHPCSAEDPHHAWEGIFRTLGIALGRVVDPLALPRAPPPPPAPPHAGRLRIEEKSLVRCRALRVTAESALTVTVDFSRQIPNRFVFDVADSIRVGSLPDLLQPLADEAGFSLQVECRALALSSSHVVLEDTGLLLGRALLEILMLRMEETGVNGAGGSVRHPDDLTAAPVRVGVSVEGRKFLSIVPLNDSRENLRKRFLVGQDVLHGIRSEDLDDFLDGLAGGMAASLVVHLPEIPEPDTGWPLIFRHLGMALQETFAINPARKGMPPGVKATLL
ncbi:MAG: HAD-IA family hydrolase [Magnetococcales bacterium]|nr:HAD-IA family hydrolase [Magnetococcales bacterium]